MANARWIGNSADKIYEQSGFTGTLTNSFSVGAVDSYPQGVSSDGTDTLWVGSTDDKAYKQSGFSSTLSDSFSVAAVDTTPTGVSWDGTDLLWSGNAAFKIYKQSGFSSTLSNSFSAVLGDRYVYDVSWDGTDTLAAADDWYATDAWLSKYSGFTSTRSADFSVNSVDTDPRGIEWDGTDTLWCGDQADKLYKQSGFSTTLSDSVSVGGVDLSPQGVTDDAFGGGGGGGTEVVFAAVRLGRLPRKPAKARSRRLDGALFHTGATPPVVPGNAGLLGTTFLRGRRIRHTPSQRRLDGALFHTGLSASAVPFTLALLGTTFLRGRRSLHSPRTRRLDGALVSPREIPGFQLATRFRPGIRSRHRSRVHVVRPHLIDWGRRYATARGLYRVFNAAEYRFYRSNTSTPPAETDAAFATSSALPATPADLYADGTWLLSVSYFNGVVDSGFLPVGPNGETYLRLDVGSGAATAGPPQGPGDWRLEQRSGGVLRVVAFYFETGSLRATEWAIAYTVDGTPPAADAPTLTPSMASNGLAVLSYDLPAQVHGTAVQVRLQTRRGTSYSEGSVVTTAIADALGPAAPHVAQGWRGQLPKEV